MNAYLAEVARFSEDDVPLENGDGVGITELQRGLIREMRQRLHSRLDPRLHNDRFLNRFLLAENYDLDKGAAMLERHLQWRQKHDLDQPIDQLLARVRPGLREWIPAPALGGEDENGYPVFWDLPGCLDVAGIQKACTVEEVVQYHGMIFMEYVYSVLTQQIQKHGRYIDKMVVVQDLTGFGLRSHRPLTTFLGEVTQCRNANYPQILKTMVVINAPRVIDVAWNLVKPFLRERTRRKIQILRGTGADRWFQGCMDRKNVPRRFGGFADDPVPPTAVPESAYLHRHLCEEDMENIVIARGSSHTLSYDVEAGDIVTWFFRLPSKDINFGIRDKASQTWLLPLARQQTEHRPALGTLNIVKPGIIEVVFDNTYSYMTGKSVLLRITVSSPDKTLEDSTKHTRPEPQPQKSASATATATAAPAAPASQAFMGHPSWLLDFEGGDCPGHLARV
ncbi:uncharacterized protein MONBRDRAFT_28275 [Monosiga brevicollis MX1]|uniref:CRAL-TRIO domain-containing protein n=1 Tax=Monosiga brevicollis TaxID=81824 RepID=A9V7P5_MONBE|nr:uncharacterized protein MONBRDRAFT_28275 [Monosiga brevicollis MX1]EDQ86341.1 predicted protein [Monosiga brevicollis MX1]|eukprot:XP_001748731.1 hypothetical protein [Monosiga brevicollis MX1]